MPSMSFDLVASVPYSGYAQPLFEDAGLTEQLGQAELVSLALERDLIGHVSALPLQPFQFGALEGIRQVASFGLVTITRCSDCSRLSI